MENINEIRNEFEKSLLDNGYKIFNPNGLNSALRGFQKRFDNDFGKKYFITIWHYNHSESMQRNDIPKGDSYECDSQFRFNKIGKDQTCNILFWGDFTPNEYREITTLRDVESFFENAFDSFGADYYEEWQKEILNFLFTGVHRRNKAIY